MSTKLIWGLKNLGKEGRKALIEEGHAWKLIEEILEDRIMY